MSTQQEEGEHRCFSEITKPLESEPVSYAKLLHDEMYIYGAYGFFDGLNLALTIPKLVFDESYSAAYAGEALHEWMITPAGIAITVIESVFLVTFSTLSYLFDDQDKNPFKRYTALIWPYVRDMLKALKWAYKGVRNIFVALFQLCGADIRYMIVPIAITLGILSVLNRWWQRLMKAERKDMMKANAVLHQEVAAKGNKLHVLAELPADEDKTYANSYVFVNCKSKGNVKRELVYIDAAGKSKPIEVDSLDLFESDLNQILVDNLAYIMEVKLNKKLPVRFIPALTNPFFKEYFDSYVYLTDNAATTQKLFYIDNQGQSQSVDKAICDKFESDLLEAKQNINLIGPTGEQIEALIQNRGGQLEAKLGLDFVDWDEYRVKMELKLKKEGRQNGSLPLRCYLSAAYAGFADSLYFYMGAMSLAIFVPPVFLAMAILSTIFAVLFIVSKLYEEYDFQRKLWATETRTRLALCVKELDLLVTEFAKISELMAYSDVEDVERDLYLRTTPPMEQRSNYLDTYFFDGSELAYIHENKSVVKLKVLNPPNPGDLTNLSTAQIKSHIQSMLIGHQEALKGRFNILLTELELREKELRSQVVHSYTSAGFEGLKNALAVQGVLSSAMFATAAVLFILSIPCPPMLVITCALVGVGCLIGFIAHALIQHHAYMSKMKPEVSPSSGQLNDFLNNFQRTKMGALAVEKPSDIRDAREAIYNRTVEPIPYVPLFEWCEILRYLFSGGVKGEKAVGEITGTSIHDTQDSSATFIVLAICTIGSSIAVGVVFALRALAKGFGRPAVDAVESKSSMEVKLSAPPSISKNTPPEKKTASPPPTSTMRFLAPSSGSEKQRRRSIPNASSEPTLGFSSGSV